MLNIKKPNTLFKTDLIKQNNKLTDRFLVPPFTIFDTKQGYWQTRKNEWLKMGIKSELGRGGDDNDFAKCLPSSIDEKYGRKVQPTSIFDPVLCEIVYRWYCPQGGIILDPFAGGSVRGVVASYLDRNYIGIDLSQKQVDENKKQFEEIKSRFLPFTSPTWLCDTSENVGNLIDKKVDFIFSCPPYYDLEVYSDDSRDISNCATYDEFLGIYEKIIAECCKLLKDDRFACFVVGNVRDSKGFYYDLVGDTIRAFEKCGLRYYNEAILVTSVGSLPVRITKQFNSGRKLGKMHQNILIFYKGDPQKIKENYSEVVL